MATSALVQAELVKKESGSKYNNTSALRYDNVTRVLFDLQERAPCPAKPRSKARRDHFGISELSTHVANLKAENDAILERITEDLDRLADRLARLHALSCLFGNEPSAMPVIRPKWLHGPVTD